VDESLWCFQSKCRGHEIAGSLIFFFQAEDGIRDRDVTGVQTCGEWYRYCLGGGRWTDLKPITSGSIALEYLPIMASLDGSLLENLSLPDEKLEIQGEDGIIHATRSLILSQAVMHSAEHKGQIAAIMKQHGFHIDLDALDVWSFVSQDKS